MTSRRRPRSTRRPTRWTSTSRSKACCCASSTRPRPVRPTASASLPCCPAAPVRRGRPGAAIRYTYADANPERITLADAIAPVPAVNVGDKLAGAVDGVLDYNFGNYMLEVLKTPTVVSGGLAPEKTRPQRFYELSIATYNVENLAPSDPDTKFQRLAGGIVTGLASPDIISVEEIQDNSGRHRRRRGRGRRDVDQADRRDQRGRRSRVQLPLDQPRQRHGRRPARRQHPRRVPLPDRPGRVLCGPVAGRLDDGDRRDPRPRPGGADPLAGPDRPDQHRVRRLAQAAGRSVPASAATR